jgi:hypothetical protein
MDPISATIGGVFDIGTVVAQGFVDAARDRAAALAQVSASNPCVARLRAQLATYGSKPLVATSDRAKAELAARARLEAQIRKHLRDPMLCPDVRASLALQQQQQAAQQRATQIMYVFGGVALFGAIGLVAVAASRRKVKK